MPYRRGEIRKIFWPAWRSRVRRSSSVSRSTKAAAGTTSPYTKGFVIFYLRMGPHPHALSLGGCAPRSGRRRFLVRTGPHPMRSSLGARCARAWLATTVPFQPASLWESRTVRSESRAASPESRLVITSITVAVTDINVTKVGPQTPREAPTWPTPSRLSAPAGARTEGTASRRRRGAWRTWPERAACRFQRGRSY